MVDDDDILLEAPLKSTSCSMECCVPSTWLATQGLEEIQPFSLWQQDVARISSLEIFKQLSRDMHRLSTQACKSFWVLDVFN